jgi:hypothetical protein
VAAGLKGAVVTRLLAAAVAVSLALVLAVADRAGADNIAASGDISNPPGGQRTDVATAALLSRAANGIGLVLPLGDTQYECGELVNYLAAYDKSWGAYKPITRPAPGNHEYIVDPDCAGTSNGSTHRLMSIEQAAGADYYTYFGDRTPPHPGYYSFDYQDWHFVVLNTTFTVVPGGATGAQLAWFKADLAANRNHKCTVVYGHHPYKATASPFASTPDLSHYWPTMVTEDVDLYLAGHNHSYERMRPIRTQGNIDYTYGPGSGGDGNMGVRTVTAGLGGRSIIPFTGAVHPASAYRYTGSYGIFKIVPDYVGPDSFLTAFKTTGGGTVDRVQWGCH